MKRARTLRAALGIALAAALCVLLLDAVGLLRFVELKTYDLLTVAKVVLAPTEFRAPLSIVAIDDATLEDEAFGAPLSFWHRKFGVVLDGLAEAHAPVVGMDFLLPQVIFDRLEPEFAGYSRVWLEALQNARRKGLRVICNYVQMDDRLLVPALPYRMAVGPENLALSNLRTDVDEFVRRQSLWFPGADGGVAQSFAWAVVKAYAPALQSPGREVAIEFLHPAASFPVWSFKDVYHKALAGNRDWLTERFSGRIVLIGATNLLDKDFVSTPMNLLARGSQPRMPGVEVHANIINTVLSGTMRTVLPAWGAPALLLAAALTAALLVLLASRRMLRGLLLPVAVGLLGVAVWLFTRGVELPVVQGVAAYGLGAVGAVLWREYGTEQDKRQLRRLFQRYLPAHVVDRLVESEDADFFKGERRELCILLSDIRGFTTWSKERPPQEVVARLNEYFEAMTGVVQRHGGVVDKFLGDGVLAFFGIVPPALLSEALDEAGGGDGPEATPSLCGARAALEMLETLETLNADWEARGEATFKIGLGLHTGPVMVGNIGSSSKSEFTVIGDPVNVASRLQSMTKELGCPILVTQAFRDAVESSMVLEDKGEVAVRGHSTMHAYALLGARDAAASPEPRTG